MKPFISNDAVLLGVLLAILAFVFITSSSSKTGWKKFYTFFPSVLACYFFPALLNWPLGLISPEDSNLYFVASRYLLPASLVLLCLSIDFKGILNLGPKALIMFFTATLGIIIGGPVALLFISSVAPDVIGGASPDDLWRGLSTVAGSWIGGGANQTAMKEIYEVKDSVFTSMVVVDVICANIWLAFLLYGANNARRVDKWLKADTSAISDLKKRVENYQSSVAKIPSTAELMTLLAVTFGAVAISHFLADQIAPWMQARSEWLVKYNLNSLKSSFFWLVVVATTIGLGVSFTRFRKMEGYGASKLGTIFIYILVATIGMQMNLYDIVDNPGLFLIGITWIAIHVGLLLLVAKIIKAPLFFVAVGSQANVGGAASAPVVAAAFSPSLTAVGALMAVLGYALGTYGAIICAQLMSMVVG